MTTLRHRPTLWQRIEAPGIGVTVGIVVFMLVNLAMGRDLVPTVERRLQPIVIPEIDMDPESLYANNCQQCHQADGLGMAGQYPPLGGSEWVTGDPETPVRILLLGLEGPLVVSGQQYNNLMPTQAHLNDEQIAILLSHVRSSFGNDAGEVDPATVSALRQELSGRLAPIAGGDELQALRGQGR